MVGMADGAGLGQTYRLCCARSGDASRIQILRNAILESVRARLVHYKCPREFHFVDELPKTVTGKIQRYCYATGKRTTDCSG